MSNLLDVYECNREKISEEGYFLVEYNVFFDKAVAQYAQFAIDDISEIEQLNQFVNENISEGKFKSVFVCVYGKEFIDSVGKRSFYADELWIDSKLSVEELEILFAKLELLKPSYISKLEDSDEYCQDNIILFKENNKVDNLKENNDIILSNLKVLYWD